MRRLPQIFLLFASLVVVVCAGYVFEEVIRSIGAHFSRMVEGEPLPLILESLAGRRSLVVLTMLLPWFSLVGLPLLTRTTSGRYWEPTSFALRYLTFLTVEMFLVLVFFSALWIPFSAIYLPFSSFRSGPDVPLAWIVLILSCLIIGGAVSRMVQIRSSRSRPTGKSDGLDER